MTPAGLQVVRTADLREEARLDLPVDAVAVSPDGNTLLLTGARSETGPDGAPVTKGTGIYQVDAQTLSVLAHLEPGSSYTVHGFSGDSHYAYVGQPLERDQTRLRTLDLASQAFLGERTGEFPPAPLYVP